MEVVKTIDKQWMILVNGFQWGLGPYDKSGCSRQTWRTKREALKAWKKYNKGTCALRLCKTI